MEQAVAAAILLLQLELMKLVGMGVLGHEILPEQIEPRLEPYTREAVLALSEMLK